MSVAILLVTHPGIGTALLNTSRGVYPRLPLHCEAVEVALDCDTDEVARQAGARAATMDEGDGVLILSDVYGATPCNIATAIGSQTHARVLAGLNLAMLLRIFNYPQKTLDDLAETALEGGKRGIIDCPTDG